jgi:hypothetical protein
MKGKKRILQELIGDEGEWALEKMKQIADGTLVRRRLAREPGPDEGPGSVGLIPVIEIQPTIAESKDALKWLYEALKGKAKQEMVVDHTGQVTTRDYKGLDDATMAKFKEMFQSAGLLPTDDVIDGEIVLQQQLLPPPPAVTTLAAVVEESPVARALVERAQVDLEEYIDDQVFPIIDETWVASWGVAGGTP